MIPLANPADAGSSPSQAGSADTLVRILRRHATERPDREACLVLPDGESEGESTTYEQLDRRARSLAAELAGRGLAGERALLLYPSGIDFVVGFLGCLYAGVVAVPAYPPRPRRRDPRLRAVARDAEPRLVLAAPGVSARATELIDGVPELAAARWLTLEDALPPPERWQEPGPAPSDTAFLQYTSGSTSAPKGVVVDHANLVHNERAIREAFGQSEDSVVVGWLPLYHDMGLIGNLLQPLYLGARCVLMPPAAFLERPLRWLRAISRYRATTSGGPNFAYELCLRRARDDDLDGLDLSHWRVAFNGAEPVRAQTLERFGEAFGGCGFRRRAFVPCYGLAEATLFVAGAPLDEPPVLREVDRTALAENRAAPPSEGRQTQVLVGCGRSGEGHRVEVVEPDSGRPCPPGRVGEIWVSGPSVARGYWGRPEATRATFHARRLGGDGSYLRTGDLGFLDGGQLFVTGRLKELIIVRGRNLYPQDLEAAARAAHPALRPDAGAAFSVETGEGEGVVLVHEVERTWRHRSEAVPRIAARAITEEHQVPVEAVVLVRPGAVPRTTSGKIRRGECRRRFLAGELEVVAEWRRSEAGRTAAAGEEPRGPRTPTEETLAALWAEVLEVDGVGIDEDLFALGGDSLTATRLVGRIRETLGVELALEALFDAPSVARLAEILDALESPAAAPEAPPLRADASDRPAPLSYPQRRLWFLHRLEPSNPVHNVAAIVRLAGRLDPAALHDALQGVVLRHEALRTRFSEEDGEPMQSVVPPDPAPLPVTDLSRIRPESLEAEIGGRARELARRPFPLEQGRLHRAALLRLAAHEHRLVVAMHHVAADGASLQVFLRETATLYEGAREGRRTPLAELPVQYRDFARWQRAWLRGEALRSRTAYWRERLAGAPPALDLPADRPRPPVPSHRGAHLERRLPPDLSAALEELARRGQATPFMSGLAVFAALVHRYTGRDDLVFGSPVSGRLRAETEGLIGVFLNALVLRVAATDDPSFETLLARVRGTAVGAYSHQEVPFEVLVDELSPPRDRSRNPLFQVMFVGQNAPLEPRQLGELRMEPREVDAGTARFDLSVSMAPGARGWLGTWKYATDLFDAATVERMARHLEALATSAVAAPHLRISELGLLSAAERHQLLQAWNATRRSRPDDRRLHELVADRAAARPDAVAVTDGSRHLSYRELTCRSAALAARLRDAGVAPDDRVGVASERSAELVVALLAVLEAGAAFLPLDPGHPRERQAFLVEDSGLSALLVQPAAASALPSAAVPVLRLERDAPAADPAVARTGPAVPPGAAAYALYTSGSTGRPKGVVVSHEAIVNRLLWMQDAFRLEDGDRVLQKTPSSFDVSVWEFFWPLLAGATLVMAPPRAHQDGVRLAELVRDERITTLHFVPSMLRAFLAEPEAARRCHALRRVIASGEALPVELARRFRELVPAELHNLYGPTEAAVDVTWHRCRPDDSLALPIGRPIQNLRIHVLDRHLRPTPPGVPGELSIGGTGLARGYLGRPGLTAERFVPDPFGSAFEDPGGRLYRTGDLARHRGDGEVEFLGRLDHQVKVRGVRVEPGEVEAALGTHSGVAEAVVVARSAAGAAPRLVAYVVPAGDQAVPAADLRDHLAGRLPEGLVPSSFVTLESLPLTRSGKVDRGRLPEPGTEDAATGTPYRAPRTPLERRLAALWEEVLEVERVGLDDEFFALGGDSIQGALLVNRLQRELGEVVYVMALFDAPTVARLAAYLESRYPASVGRLGGVGREVADGPHAPPPRGSEAEGDLEAVVRRRLRRPSAPPDPATREPAEDRNPPAVFILSPFRSGSTLLRVMLQGHSRLFAPPELELLHFRTLGERQAAYGGRDRFALEGLVRAVMELERCDAERAWRHLAGLEEEDLPVGRVYRWLQESAGGRGGDTLLVDKTPSYALLPETLARAETLFHEPRYVHLVRHPLATIDSYVEARMDRVYRDFPYPPREQAEVVWRLAHRNVLAFLPRVPENRWLRLSFEDLVRSPRATMERLCKFLGLELEPAVLEPYRGSRMTDGLHAGSRMMGDPKFDRHRGIDAAVAERWRERPRDVPLDEATRRLAAELGYPDEGAAPDRPALSPRAERRQAAAGEPPLSFAQERLWFLTELEPVTVAYNMPAAVRLDGVPDLSALARSFAHVLRRHEVLRTGYPEVAGRPAARVAPPPAAGQAISMPVVDLGALGPAGDAEARRLAREEGARPFDLSRPPMLRVLLVRRSAAEHLLLVTMHHIASDGWSIGVLVRELAALYPALRSGDPPPLPPLPLQYADHAAWQRRWLDARTLDRHLAYWRRRLAGPLPALDLPSDRPRPPAQRFRGGRRTGRLSPEETARVESWSRSRGTTPFLTLLAAFDALLHRYTGQDDLLLGIPIANRNRVEVEPLVGFFLNMVVQRTDASGDPTFGELLERSARGFLESTPHQEVPFEKVVEAVQPRRDRSRSPIFQIQFSLQNTPTAPLELPGLRLELLDLHNGTTKFDLTVFLFQEREGLRTTLEYDRDLFDATTMDRFLVHWHTVLLGAVEDPERRLSRLPLLPDSERAQVLAQWNDPLAAYDPGPCLHRLFEAQAAQRGDEPAVVHELEEVSYRELDRRAEVLARRLRALGVGPEVPVGLALDRSVELAVGILGILKAGGAYVPLDPAYPQERIAWVLGDALAGAEPAVVVTRERFAARFGSGEGAQRRVVPIDGEGAVDEAAPPAVPARPPSPDQLAYVIYTSGSTGRPKGVQVTHGQAVRLLRATEAWFGFGPGDVWTLFHSYAFDFSVWEIWGALAYGGRLVVVPQDVARSPSAFYDLLASEGVTVLNQTPSAFRQLVAVEGEHGTRPLALREVIFGGEALDLPALRPWIDRHGDAAPRLVNMYGITETTVHVTYRPVRAADLAVAGASPVGRPIPDLQVHLLGALMEPVPLGAAGEIHVGGAGVARGYLGRPGLTAGRFVPDPFRGQPGARLYKSGDLARRRPDGDLLYGGRIDHQVKVRGFRIELGEIEGALSEHPGVAETAVAAHAGDGPEGVRLVAYVVPGAEAPEPARLRRHLAQRLPDYMVPSAFVLLASLPKTPTGKLDRRSLPEPGEVRREPGAGSRPPETATERRLAEVWREVLSVDRVGRDDDFFDLGGHSLLATQLASRTREAFGIDLTVAAVFEHTTLAALAARVDALRPLADGEEGRDRPAADGPPPIEPVPRDGELPLSYAQERLWFVEELEGGRSRYRVPVALQVEGPLHLPAFARSLREVVRRHEALRTTFPSRSGRPFQQVHPDRRPDLPVVDLRGLEPATAATEGERLVAVGRRWPFDLAAGPLLRVALARLPAAGAAGGEAPGRRRHLLLVTMHHLVSDGWSLGLFLRETAALYRAFSDGRPSPLPELPVQYADFAVWQRRWLAGEVLEAEIEHWRRRLDRVPPLDLPTDREPSAGQVFRAGDLPFRLGEDVVARLTALGQRRGASLFMTLLAAFQLLLSRHAGRDDVAVGSPVANRHHREVEGLIGFFVNTLVLRTDLSGRPGFGALVERVRDTTLDAYEHQDLPFAKLVEALKPERRRGATPFLEAMFALHNQPMPELELGEATLRPVGAEGHDGHTSSALSVRLWHDGGGLVGGFGYNAGLLDRSTAERWRRHFLALIESAAADPDLAAAALPLLPPGERHQVLVEWPPAAGRGGDRRTVRVLDRHGRPAPIGIPGMLAGDGEPAAGEERARFLADGRLERLSAAATAGSDPGRPDSARRSDVAKRRQGLSQAKRELLERRLRGERSRSGGRTVATPGGASPLVPLQPDGASGEPPLFLVHAIGGTVFCYRELGRLLGSERPVYGLQAPGVQGERPPHREVERLAEEYVAAVRSAVPGGPYLLAGWSFGGVVAYEVARRLREAGGPVRLLALVDSRLPEAGQAPPAGDETALLVGLFRDLQAQRGGRPGAPSPADPRELLGTLPEGDPETRLAAAIERARHAGLLPGDVSLDRFRALLEVYRANLQALYRYRPAPYPGPVVVFRPQAAPASNGPPYRAWERVVGGRLEVQAVPGDHYSALAPPHVATLAERLGAHIREAIRETAAAGGSR